ncbi:hypothetical protein HYE68_003219 [Fusarium pseudograminearum]|nr:hypothetical protein HYE68_003219 [Fusarium pseudograminearum]
MPSLKKEHLEAAVEQNPVCLLGLTSWSVDYILHKFNHGGTCTIASKQGNKTLPPELWNMILSYLDEDIFCPVYPIGVTFVQIDHDNLEPAVIFNRIDTWWGFGDIRNGFDLSYYNDWLLNPSYEPVEEKKKRRPEYYPFPDFSKTVLPGQSVTIPVSNLEFNDDFLVHGLEVPEMIAFCERGECHLCDGRRKFCARCPDGKAVMEKFTRIHPSRVSCGTQMLCPLCIGVEYAMKSVCETAGWFDGERMSDEEYQEWSGKRLKRLGYME